MSDARSGVCLDAKPGARPGPRSGGATRRLRHLWPGGAVLVGILLAGVATPVAAQDADTRLRKIEAEVRALQRKVFPGGSERFFAQDAGSATANAPAGQPASSAVSDILVRLDAMEAQLAQLTGQTEQNANALAQLTGRIAALEARAGIAPAQTTPVTPPATGTTGSSAVTPPAAVTPATPPAPTGASAARLAAVQAITKPDSGDNGEDEYTYGFRLWDAKFYPEAQMQLRKYVDSYPSHRMISYGRNLLGRAYLDDGKSNDAAPWFLRNYQADKQGARAGDSLLFLAETMIASGDTKRACIALAEFGETYPALASGRLASQYQANLGRVKCN